MSHHHDTDIYPTYINLKSSSYTTKFNTFNYLFELNRIIYGRQNVDMILSIDSFKFTNSFYNINQYNNTLYYRLDSDSYITLYTLIVTPGNYSATTLINYLNSNTPFTFTFDDTTFKISVTHPTDDFLFVNNNNHINDVLGFYTLTSTSSSLTADNLINLIGIQMLYVISNLSTRTVLDKNDTLNNNVILSAPVNSHPGDVQIYIGKHNHKLSNNNINAIEITIVDQNNNQVDFNGIDWYLNLSINYSHIKPMILPAFLSTEEDKK